MKKSLAISLFFILTHGLCLGQGLAEALDPLLTRAFPADGPGVAVLVARGNNIIYEKAFGKANLELNVAMRPDHVFRIGSITKQFTACAILQLAEKGKLSLQDRVSRFIKDYPADSVTIEHLLTHTSGINSGAGAWTPETRKNDFSPRQLIDLFKDQPREFLPGAQFRYNNNGYVLLGYIIAQVSGMPYENYITEHIFRPLGMMHSFYDSTSSIIPNRASGYMQDDGTYKNARFLSMTQPYAAGSLLSTVGDLYTWNKALASGKVIGRESLERAHTSYRLENGSLTGYGYGWWLGNVQGSRSIRHDGAINGFSTCAVYLPEEAVFVAVLSNCENTNADVIASKITGIAIGKPYHTDKITLPAERLKSYAAVYQSATEGQRIVSYEGGRLLYFVRGGDKQQLIPFEEDRFYFENNLSIVTFSRKQDGSIGAMVAATAGKAHAFARTGVQLGTRRAIDMPAEALERYVGKYRFSNNFILSITRDGNRLYGKGAGPGQTRQEIVPYDTCRFFARNLDAELLFNLDKHGVVTGLMKIQNGEQAAEKVE